MSEHIYIEIQYVHTQGILPCIASKSGSEFSSFCGEADWCSNSIWKSLCPILLKSQMDFGKIPNKHLAFFIFLPKYLVRTCKNRSASTTGVLETDHHDQSLTPRNYKSFSPESTQRRSISSTQVHIATWIENKHILFPFCSMTHHLGIIANLLQWQQGEIWILTPVACWGSKITLCVYTTTWFIVLQTPLLGWWIIGMIQRT